MIQGIDKDRCVGCGSCVIACQHNCIRMEADERGFFYPTVEESLCTHCGLCKMKCPVASKEQVTNEEEKTYALKILDDEVRLSSSSGGAFSLLSSGVFKKEGIVYGVALDDSFSAIHVPARNQNELQKLRGSKYIQSLAGKVYAEIKEHLSKGGFVYFSGTACQVNGLYSYLGKRPQNLITQDVICHGVCSKSLFDGYIKYHENNRKEKVKSINFRNKTNGWSKYSVCITFSDESELCREHSKDEFMRIYTKNYALRSSCYHCEFKGINRLSDITLADFWGIKNFVKEMDDDKGVSWVICHTAKGRQLFDSVKHDAIYKEVEYKDVIKYNMSGEISPIEPADNPAFISDLSSVPFTLIVKKYCKLKGVDKIKQIVRSFITTIVKR